MVHRRKKKRSIINLREVKGAKKRKLKACSTSPQPTVVSENVLETKISVKAVFITEGAAGMEVLLIRERADGSGTGVCPGLYDVVGGTVRCSETIEDALLRECKEECGQVAFDAALPVLRVQATSKHHSNRYLPVPLFSIFNDNKSRLYYLILVNTRFVPTLSNDHDTYVWADAKKLASLITTEQLVPNLDYVLLSMHSV